jgi:DNA polymerase-3 subunit gamma/tau
VPELHELYRPENINEFFGNENIKQILQAKIDSEDLPQSLMFIGERGCGKSTLSRLLPKLYKASFVYEVNVGDKTGVDDMRKLLSKIHLSPLVRKGETKRRFYILNEFHMASLSAQNALLDDSEKPPKDVYFIICTTDPQKIIKPIKSRFTQFEVKPLSMAETMDLLGWVCREENKLDVPLKVLRKIAQVSEGIPREALILLNKVLDIEDEQDALDAVVKTEENAEVRDICLALGDRKVRDPWPVVRDLLKRYKGNPEEARQAIAGWFTAILLNSKSDDVTTNRATVVLSYFLDNLFYTGKPGLVAACRAVCMELKN